MISQAEKSASKSIDLKKVDKTWGGEQVLDKLPIDQLNVFDI